MKSMKVLVCDELHEVCIKILVNNGLQVDYEPRISGEELLEIVGNYDCLVVRGRTKIDEKVLRRARRLKLIARAGSGLENIDLKGAEKRGIRVIRCPDAIADSVAEFTIALMIILARRIEKAIDSLRRGLWIKDKLVGSELRGKTLGIIGVGSVGSRVARIALGMGMKLLLNDIKPLRIDLAGDVRSADLHTLLKLSDFVSIHIPLNEETYGFIGEDELRSMKSDAYLINTSRPELIDPDALYKALTEGWIAGAAVEATENWTRAHRRLMKLENLICTPHIGAQTLEARRRVSEEVARAIIRELNLCRLP